MKKLITPTALLLSFPMWLGAADADKLARGEAYFFFGPIVSNTRYEFNPACFGLPFPAFGQLPAYCTFTKRGGVNTGFGGEVFVYKGLSAGAEAGYGGQDWEFSGNGVGVASIDAAYHFFRTDTHRRLQPFVVGGYSLYYGDRTAFQSGFNIGGGVNLWFCKHAALRLELRDQDHINYFHSQFTRFLAFRVGMTFR